MKCDCRRSRTCAECLMRKWDEREPLAGLRMSMERAVARGQTRFVAKWRDGREYVWDVFSRSSA